MTPHLIDIGKGKAIIFQHGLASSSLQVQILLEGLSDYRLICVDCPGHGKSELDAAINPSFQYYTEVIIEVMDRLGITKTILGGLSMGAGIAVHAAINFPDRVEALILHRPAWLEKSNPVNLNILNIALEYIDHSNGKEYFKQTEAYKTLQDYLPLAANSVLGVFSQDQRKNISRVISSMYKDVPFSSLESIREIEVPMLIMGNEYDPLHPFEISVEIDRYASQSTLHKITSRYINPELHKKQVHSHIINFLNTL